MATSERDLLVEKASSMRDGIVEAEAALEKLREGGQGKVGLSILVCLGSVGRFDR